MPIYIYFFAIKVYYVYITNAKLMEHFKYNFFRLKVFFFNQFLKLLNLSIHGIINQMNIIHEFIF